MFFKKYAFKTSFHLLILCVFIFLSLESCSMYKYMYLSKKNKHVVLYGNYLLSFGDFNGRASNTKYGLNVYIRFVEPINYNLVDIDTIPIITLDSVCFKGNCISENTCKEFISNFAPPYDTAFYIENSDTFHRDLSPPDTGFAIDLFTLNNGKIIPFGFFVLYGMELPVECQKSEITVIIYSRLNDRTNGKLIDQDIKEIKFDLKKKLKWYNILPPNS